MSDGISFLTVELTAGASDKVDELLAGRNRDAVQRWKWLALKHLAALRIREASIEQTRPKGAKRKQLLKAYRDALQLVSRPHVDDPYGCIWQELEAELIEQDFGVPSRLDLQKAAGTMAVAADRLAEKPGQRGRPSGRLGLGAAMKTAAVDWQECFGEEPATSKSSAFVRAVQVILEDLDGEGHNTETLRSVVRVQSEQDDSSDDRLNDALKHWPVIGFTSKK